MAKAKEEKVNAQTTADETVLPQSPEGVDNPSVSEADSSPCTGEPTMAELVAEEKKRMEEYVTIQLLKDDGKYKDDVYVSVNGQNCVIQRGVPVRIKRKFALELAKSQFEDQRTAARIALLSEKAENAKF